MQLANNKCCRTLREAQINDVYRIIELVRGDSEKLKKFSNKITIEEIKRRLSEEGLRASSELLFHVLQNIK